MCDPGTIAISSLMIGAASSGTSFMASQADYAAKSQAWQQNVVNSEAAARDADTQIISNQLAEQGKTDQQKQISVLSQAQKQGVAGVNAAGGNVSGVSVDNVLSDIAGKSEVNRSYADENYKYVVANTQEQLTSANDQEQSRINSTPVPQSPSPLAPLIGIAGAGVNAAKGYVAAGNGPSGSSGD